ncbi:phytanoyl-CoA dioxygenase family protein [Sphingomonas aliaeris]|uniref:phytanoyl-CoA dioxygenase family protein n=1 Tax=Sphingomonas aliaeris TaxID=2759526 RepID=UPI001CED4446|nr:phytanoyl-CoA dioxygenase family protein [Sphingomonas aliaeris]
MLDDSWNAIAIMLRDRGIAQSALGALALPGADAMFASASALIDDWRPRLRSQAQAGMDFLMVPATEIAARPEIFRFGLNPVLLRLAEAHIGLPVAYDGVTVQYTMADGREVSTRDWHRDREDRRMVKLAIYLNDVDEAGGPFQLLPGERADGNFYLREKADADLRAAPPVSCEGAAGTIVFADTARYFHRGKPATKQDRAALFFSYFAKRPQRPYFCERSGLTRRQIAVLTEGMTPEQRDAALWQRALPLRWRFIPPAAL